MLALDVVPAPALTLEVGFLAADAGCGLGVFPKVGIAGFALEILEFRGKAGEVKDAPEVR